MTMPIFLHIEATPNPNQQDSLQAYLSQAPSILKQHGGVPIATYDVEAALDGKDAPAIFIVVSFPNREAISAFFDDPSYLAIIPLRDRGFSHIRFYVTNERIN